MLDRQMREKIFLAKQDKRNGSIFAIYARIRKTGSPFKCGDKRKTYTGEMQYDDSFAVSKQVFYWRLKHGWTVEKARTTPTGKQGRKYDKNTGEVIPNSVLAD